MTDKPIPESDLQAHKALLLREAEKLTRYWTTFEDGFHGLDPAPLEHGEWLKRSDVLSLLSSPDLDKALAEHDLKTKEDHGWATWHAAIGLIAGTLDKTLIAAEPLALFEKALAEHDAALHLAQNMAVAATGQRDEALKVNAKLEADDAALREALQLTNTRLEQALASTPIRDADEVLAANRALLQFRVTTEAAYDELREREKAQVAAAYEVLTQHCLVPSFAGTPKCKCGKFFHCPDAAFIALCEPEWQKHIRQLTPADAKAALDALVASAEARGRLEEAKRALEKGEPEPSA